MPCKVKSFPIIQHKCIPGLLFLLSDLKTKTVSLNVIDGFLDKAEAGIVRLLKLTSAEVVRSWGESEWCCAELRELSSNEVCFKMAWCLDLLLQTSSVSSFIEPNLTKMIKDLNIMNMCYNLSKRVLELLARLSFLLYNDK